MILAATPMSSSPNIQNNSSAFYTMKSSTILGLNLDTFVLLSLLFQFILMITAPSMKHLGMILAMSVVWTVYQLQSNVSRYAMGRLIPNNTFQGGRTGKLRIFWAPFLILHLGGPYTITSLSMADNELWLRFAVQLVSFSHTFSSVFLQSFLKNDLWIPTAILFLAAALRYVEKAICQFLARLNKFRESTLPKPDPGVNYAKLMHTRKSFLDSTVPAGFQEFQIYSSQLAMIMPGNGLGVIRPKRKLSQVEIVKQAYRFFHDFRGLFANSVYSYDLREYSRRYFLSIDDEDAFSICEVELNFAYDVFYTKSILIDKPISQWLNLASLLLQLVATVLWIKIDKASFHPPSVKVTNALVYGSISFDLFSYLMLAVSDWGIALVNRRKLVNCCFEVWLLFKKHIRERQRRMRQRRMWKLGLLSVFFRWSESVPQLELIKSCINKRSMVSIARETRNENGWISIRYFTGELRKFMFSELVIRSGRAQQPRDVEEICSSRGMWILGELSRDKQVLDLATTLEPWVSDVDYEESLILWNIATTLCYSTSDGVETMSNGGLDGAESMSNGGLDGAESMSNRGLDGAESVTHGGLDGAESMTHGGLDGAESMSNGGLEGFERSELLKGPDLRECSKVLADYMMHLLNRTMMMPLSEKNQDREIFLDTCADTKRFLDRKLPRGSNIRTEKLLQQACEKILQVNTDLIPPRQIRGDKSKSVLFDGCMLAKRLQKLEDETKINKWEIISKVLAEMLFYCAARSPPSVHLERLVWGGELLTIVWLLMAHLGLGNHFRYKKDTTTAELVIA